MLYIMESISNNDWVSVNSISGVTIGEKFTLINQGSTPLLLQESDTKPDASLNLGKVLQDSGDEGLSRTVVLATAKEIWVKSSSNVKGRLYVQTTYPFTDFGETDPRVQSGGAALTVQSYDESNKKAGVQWEASRLVNATNATYYYSVIVTGDKPVDLKRREFAYTDLGLIGYIYKNPTYTGGTPDEVYNMTDINPVASGIQLLTGITITNPTQIPTNNGTNAPAAWGTPFGAPIYAIGPVNNQTSGSTTQSFASNRILAPNTSYLLVFYSRSAQEISARLEWYEGDIDRNGGGVIV
jgi:hypothetical protein